MKRQKESRKSPRKQPSVLRIMAFLLMASVALRVGENVATASASQSLSSGTANVARADEILGMPIDNQTLPQLLEIFREREAALLIAEQAAAERAAVLAEAEIAIADQLAELTEAEAKLADTLAMADVAAAEDLARLATVYENMKPRDSAALFSEMAPSFAAGFLGLMRPEAAAAIMTELEPATAHLISVMLAGRNATAPTRQE